MHRTSFHAQNTIQTMVHPASTGLTPVREPTPGSLIMPSPSPRCGVSSPLSAWSSGRAADGGLQGVARGGEGISGDSSEVCGVRRASKHEDGGSAPDVSSDAAVEGHACSSIRTLRARMLHGEGRPCRPRWECETRWRKSRCQPHLARGEICRGGGGVRELPPLSCGDISGAAAIAVDESDSALGQVLLLGGRTMEVCMTSSVRLVDLATGVCTPQAELLYARAGFAAARLLDGRIVCTEETFAFSAEVYKPLVQGTQDTEWTCRDLPDRSDARFGFRGCVLSDGRFAVLGGSFSNRGETPSPVLM